MKKSEKHQLVQDLAEKLKSYGNFYLADIGGLEANETVELRKLCYESGIKLQVVKNKLILKALEQLEISDKQLLDTLKGPSSILFSETIHGPAQLIKKFRAKSDKPVLKAAYIDEAIFIGDNSLENILNLKSKEEIIGEVITILQSPAKNVISGLKSAGTKLASILNTSNTTLTGLLKSIEHKAK